MSRLRVRRLRRPAEPPFAVSRVQKRVHRRADVYDRVTEPDVHRRSTVTLPWGLSTGSDTNICGAGENPVRTLERVAASRPVEAAFGSVQSQLLEDDGPHMTSRSHSERDCVEIVR